MSMTIQELQQLQQLQFDLQQIATLPHNNSIALQSQGAPSSTSSSSECYSAKSSYSVQTLSATERALMSQNLQLQQQNLALQQQNQALNQDLIKNKEYSNLGVEVFKVFESRKVNLPGTNMNHASSQPLIIEDLQILRNALEHYTNMFLTELYAIIAREKAKVASLSSMPAMTEPQIPGFLPYLGMPPLPSTGMGAFLQAPFPMDSLGMHGLPFYSGMPMPLTGLPTLAQQPGMSMMHAGMPTALNNFASGLAAEISTSASSILPSVAGSSSSSSASALPPFTPLLQMQQAQQMQQVQNVQLVPFSSAYPQQAGMQSATPTSASSALASSSSAAVASSMGHVQTAHPVTVSKPATPLSVEDLTADERTSLGAGPGLLLKLSPKGNEALEVIPGSKGADEDAGQPNGKKRARTGAVKTA